jgi:hypothetical protein
MATGAPPATATAATGRMDRYLWLILLSAFLAWMLDSVALNVFNLVLTPSLRDLLGTSALQDTDRAERVAVGP